MPPEPPAAPEVQARFERASTGRAKCRACDERIAKSEWRVGELAPNPFTEGVTTYWFHARCAALRRPESFIAATERPATDTAATVEQWKQEHPEATAWRQLARSGQERPRLARLSRVEVSPSGRARCRHCRELIDKASLRIVLHLFQDGRFEPMGFLHLRCTVAYLGGPLDGERLEVLLQTVAPGYHSQLTTELGAASASSGASRTMS